MCFQSMETARRVSLRKEGIRFWSSGRKEHGVLKLRCTLSLSPQCDFCDIAPDMWLHVILPPVAVCFVAKASNLLVFAAATPEKQSDSCLRFGCMNWGSKRDRLNVTCLVGDDCGPAVARCCERQNCLMFHCILLDSPLRRSYVLARPNIISVILVNW